MKKTLLLLVLGLLAVVSACGQHMEEKRSLEPFSVINVAGSIDLVYEQGNSYGVRLSGSAGAIESLDVRVRGKSLNICRKDYEPDGFGGVYIESEKKAELLDVTVYVTSPDITTINKTGSGTVRAERIATRSLTFNSAGSGLLKVGRLSADKVSLNMAGSGKIDAGKVKAKTVNMSLAGVGEIEAHVAEASSLSCSAIGMGVISVSGSVDRYSKAVIGGGSINDSSLKYATMTNSTMTNSNVYNNLDGSLYNELPRTVDGIVVNP